MCCLLDKKARRVHEMKVDYVGFECPDEFVVGYGEARPPRALRRRVRASPSLTLSIVCSAWLLRVRRSHIAARE